VVDDCSSTKVHVKGATGVVHNRFRCGCGPSRNIGVLYAKRPWILLVDGHMRFPAGWYDRLLPMLSGQPHETVYCCACAALDKFHPTLASAKAVYRYGATLNLYGPDPVHPKQKQVFEVNWSKRPSTFEGGSVPCLMGAGYLIAKSWFDLISPLRFLRYWGCDEAMISIKTYLAGGKIQMLEDIAIGHRFWSPGEKQGFTVRAGYTLYNKMFACHTLLAPDLAETLIARMRLVYDHTECIRATEMIKENWYLVEYERTRNASIFQIDFMEYVRRFDIPLPGDKG